MNGYLMAWKEKASKCLSYIIQLQIKIYINRMSPLLNTDQKKTIFRSTQNLRTSNRSNK